jgi:hypothetical protein
MNIRGTLRRANRQVVIKEKGRDSTPALFISHLRKGYHVENDFNSSEIEYYKDRILGAFPGAKIEKAKTEADIQCPDPEGRHENRDSNPSLGVDLKRNGSGVYVVLNCRSQRCNKEEILRSVGLGFSDLYYDSKNGHGKKVLLPGCTLEEYAKHKRLPVDFLTGEEVGLENDTYFCSVRGERVPAVSMPYADEDGNELVEYSRWRTGLFKTTPDVRIRSLPKSKGGKLTLYGRWRREEAIEAGYVLLVEGESDCHVAWYSRNPAFGVPGAGNWRNEWADLLEGIKKILVMVEPDEAGAGLWDKVSSCPSLQGRVY